MNASSLMDATTTRLAGLSTIGWILLVLALLLVAVVALLVWRRMRRRKAAGGPPVAEPAPPERGPDLNHQLRSDWRRFRRGLPAAARRSLDQFHPVVVLGTESAGKAQLIERFGGVAQRRVELGSGAAFTDGQLRCLLGGDVLLIDLAEEVVRAPRELVDAGLRRALASTLRRRTPVVVVCLSPEALDRQSEQQLAELGGALRAKLEVLAGLRDEPLAVRVVVGDVPGAARFDALFRLLELPGIPAVLPIDDPGDEAMRASLLAYADELGTALTELTPRETLDLVGFLDALPHLAGALSMVLSELFAPGGELTPRPDGLYLVPARGGPNPLAVPESLRRPGPSPLLKHRLVALTGTLVVVVVLLAAYRRDSQAWDQASAAAWSYELESEHEIHLRLAIRAYTSGVQGSLLDRLTPGFFTTGPTTVACSFVEQVRQDHVLDQLADGLAMPPERRRPEQVLYAAALLYATRDNDLGHLIHDRLDEWAVAAGLEPSLVVDYLRLAGPYRDESWIERLREAAQAPPDDGFDVDLDRLLRLLAADRVWQGGELDEAVELATRLRPELRARARYGAAQRILVTPPLDRLAPVFKVHAARFGMLAELWQNQRALESVLQTVLEGPPAPPGRSPQTFTDVVAAVSPMLGAAAGAAPSALVMDGHEYPVDPGGFVRELRGAEAERVLAEFLARAPEDGTLLFFPAAAATQQVSLRVNWPNGISGARAHARMYSREAFEQTVKPAALATGKLIEALAGRPALAQRMGELLDGALDVYAVGYDQELERLFGSFAVDVTSEAGARRVLAALAGKRSPLRELVHVVAQDAALGLADDASGRFDDMLDAEERFGGLTALFQAGKGGDAFVAYQDLLRDVSEKLAAAPPAAPGGDALSARLSRAGALTLGMLAGAKGSALEALADWEGDAGLTDEQAAPFRAPLRAVLALGARDIERALVTWNRELERAAGAELFSRFPFDRRSADDVDPEAISAWLHPKSGRLALEIAPLVAGLVQRTRTGDGRWHHASAHPCGSGGLCVEVPPRLLETLDRLASASDVFWDDAGKPRPIALEVTPRPFTVASHGGPVPELVRLSAGAASVFYFNQRPRRSRVEIDWTHDQVASLSVQLEQKGSLSLTPPALVVGGSPWSLLRLMQQADRRGSTRTFRVPLDDSRVLAVSYDVVDPSAEALAGASAVAAGTER
jgi:type VI secretion system protein ImpL